MWTRSPFLYLFMTFGYVWAAKHICPCHVAIHTSEAHGKLSWDVVYILRGFQTIFFCQSSFSKLMCRCSWKVRPKHVLAVYFETVERCAPAVLRLAWCENFSRRVDGSEPARFFRRQQFLLPSANSWSNYLLSANFVSKFLLSAILIFVSKLSQVVSKFDSP